MTTGRVAECCWYCASWAEMKLHCCSHSNTAIFHTEDGATLLFWLLCPLTLSHHCTHIYMYNYKHIVQDM